MKSCRRDIEHTFLCKWRNMLEGLNTQTIVTVISSDTNEEIEQDLIDTLLNGIESRISKKIIKGNYGATKMDDPATN